MRALKAILLGTVVLLSVQPGLAQDTGDPSEVNLKIEAMWVSPNADCTNATMVFEELPAVYRDMMQNPVFASAAVNNGTYECLAFRMSDQIQGQSAYDSTSGNCTNGQQINQDIFGAGSTSTCPDGTVVSGTAGEDTPCVYFSTSGTGGADAYDPASALPLSASYNVTSDKFATFVTDFRGKVVDTGSTCEIFPPVFSFRE